MLFLFLLQPTRKKKENKQTNKKTKQKDTKLTNSRRGHKVIGKLGSETVVVIIKEKPPVLHWDFKGG